MSLNPLIRKGYQERLRTKQLVAWGLFTLILTSFVYMTSYLEGRHQPGYYDYQLDRLMVTEPSDTNGARTAFPFLLATQGFLLLFLGTGRVAAGTAEERETGLLDYQRMTPMSPFGKITGYLFGLPGREYFMFALTLPFLLHAVVVGGISAGKTLHLYAVFFSCVLLYHLTAHVTGLVVSKPRAASWVSRMVVLGLYVVLPALGQAGFSFLSFLTLMPTYFGLMSEELKPVSRGGQEYGYSPWTETAEFWREVTFFDLTLSPSLFTVLMQGLLLAALFTTAHRKWRNETMPAFSKPFGIGFFVVLQVLLLGCLWQYFGEGRASGLLGTAFTAEKLQQVEHLHPQEMSAEEANFIAKAQLHYHRQETSQTFALVQTILFTLSLFAALLILHVTCPTRHQYLKGKRRAAKLGLHAIPVLADEKPGWPMTAALLALMPITHFALLAKAGESGLFFRVAPGPEAYVLPCLLFGAVLVYLRAARESWFNVGFWGFIGLLWVTPLLIGMVLAVGWKTDAADYILYVVSFSPPAAFYLSFVHAHEIDFGPFEDSVKNASYTGVIVACAIAGWLAFSQFRRRLSWDERENELAAKRHS